MVDVNLQVEVSEMDTSSLLDIGFVIFLTWGSVFGLLGLLSFTYVFFKGRKGVYREKLWDARRELEDAANIGAEHGHQPKSNSLNPRSPGDE